MSKKRFNGNKGKKFVKKDEDKLCAKQSLNDVSWYNKNKMLLEAAGKLSFNNPLGLPTYFIDENYRYKISETASGIATSHRFPGIMVLRCVPTVGISKDGSSDVNYAMRQLYAFVRHANSGSRNYEAPDYMTYLIALRSAYDFYAEMVRLYGIFNTYSTTNRYIGRAMVEALGYDYTDFVNKIASLRYYINQYAVRINTFAAPKELTFFDRGAFVPMHIYKDAKDDKAAFYLMQYSEYFTWSGTQSAAGSSCIPVTAPTYATVTKCTLDKLITFGNQLIDALLTNEDIGLMSGDTLKAFGNDKLRTLVGIPTEYASVPVYNEVMLEQIHNTVVVPDLEEKTVYQANGNIIYNPSTSYYADDLQVKMNELMGAFVPMLDTQNPNPSPDYVMELTRNMITFREDAGVLHIDSCGSEIFHEVIAYTYTSSGSVTPHDITGLLSRNWLAGAISTDQLFNQLIVKTTFDYSPAGYLLSHVAQDTDTLFTFIPIGEIFNYTPISKDTLRKINNCALLSMFNIAGLGKAV